MKICFDTSVVIDIMGKTPWFKDSFAAYDVAMVRRFEPYLSTSSTTDIVCVLHSRSLLSAARARTSLDAIFNMFFCMDNIEGDCRAAYASKMEDYEDALIAHSAKRNGIDFIITRNKKDFENSPVPALTPTEFLKIYKPADMDYDSIEL